MDNIAYFFLEPGGVTDDNMNICEEDVLPKCLYLNKDVLVLGRGSPRFPADIMVSKKKEGKEILSRQHAEIARNKAKAGEKCTFIIRDMGSTNGTFVNNIRVDSWNLREGQY